MPAPMPVARPGAVLWGRDRELARVARTVRESGPDVGGLVIAGEPGIGKSSLWAHGVEVGHRIGARVLATTCVQAETEMPYVALEDLIGELLDAGADTLPAPQRTALDAALLRTRSDTAIDLRTVARAVLTLLDTALERGRVLLAIDDLHWIDAETHTCLVHALRRLSGRPLTLLFASRDPSPLWLPPEDGPEVTLMDTVAPHTTVLRPGPLPGGSLREMLRDQRGIALSVEDGHALADETGGNPFWALQLGRPGRCVADEGAPILAALVADRVADLDAGAVDAACLVAALGRSPVEVVVNALGDGAESALDRAATAGLVSVAQGRFTCPHPLIGAGLLAALPPFRRRRLHRRAAGLTASPEARAQHLTQATEVMEPAERTELLGALDAAVDAARRRGAVSTATRFALRALTLVEDRPGRDESPPARRVAIAELQHRGSAPDHAIATLERVDLGELPPDVLERAGPLLALLTHRHRGGAAARAVVEAIAALPSEGLTPARRAGREALVATLRADLWCGAIGDRRAIAAEAVERTATSGVGLPLRRQALSALTRARLDAGEYPGDDLERLRVAATDVAETDITVHSEVTAGIACWSVTDMAGARAAFADAADRFLVVGDEPGMVLAADMLACAELVSVSATAADRTLARLAEHVDPPALEQLYFVRARGLLHLARGEHDALEAMLDRWLPSGPTSRPGTKLRAMLARRRGDLAEAARLLTEFCTLADDHGVRNPILRLDADAALAETLIALGEHDRAARIADGLGAAARGRAQVFYRAQQLRIRARLAARHDLDAALSEARGAVALHEHAPFPVDHAHSRLVLAEVHDLRGETDVGAAQRRDARELFAATGQTWWAARAAQIPPPGPSLTLTDLSPSERSVVTLVATGATNREAAAQLHLSVRTVENHLARAYRKLGVRSRSELRARAPRPTPHDQR